ncbi:GAD-like domain-containing protein [Bacteroides sp.]|uniref:GAD-like domain-containing protein n=1 Tax=Bacteroides sp. TaxID=29523 RepID=UPI003AB37963
MYERFLEQNTGCTRQTVHDAFLAKYADTVPKELIALWQEVGLGIFCNGLFRVINPADYQEFVDEYFQREYNEGAIPFMVTAFGDLFVYVNNHIVGDYVIYINVRYGTDKILSNNIALLLNKYVFNESTLKAWFKVERYAEIKDKVGLPQLDECLGYVPALALGGTENDEHIQILKTVPYIEIIAQSIGEFERIR